MPNTDVVAEKLAPRAHIVSSESMYKHLRGVDTLQDQDKAVLGPERTWEFVFPLQQ